MAGGSVLGSLGLLFGISFALDARERRRRRTLAPAARDDLIYAIETSLEFRALDSDSPVRQRYDRALGLYAPARDERGAATTDTGIRTCEGSAERALYLLTDIQSSLGTLSQTAWRELPRAAPALPLQRTFAIRRIYQQP